MNGKVLILLLLIYSIKGLAQDDKIYKSVVLDSFVVVANNEFNVKSFIDKIQEDTSFYQAFKNLRFISHTAKSNISVLDKKSEESAKEDLVVKQHCVGLNSNESKMWQEVLSQKIKGKLQNKKGEYRFTTAELYHAIFFPADTAIVSKKIIPINKQKYGDGKRDEQKHQLKLLIFNPGSKIDDVPVVGKKLSIFDDEMTEYYNYKISIAEYQGKSCYLFTCVAKPDVKDKKTVIKSLTTYFDKETMMVLHRSYDMEYDHLLFKFDVEMEVENIIVNGDIFPAKIKYDGEWNVPFKKAERFRVTLRNSVN